MASRWYPHGLKRLIETTSHLETGGATLRIRLVDSGLDYDASHETMASVMSGHTNVSAEIGGQEHSVPDGDFTIGVSAQNVTGNLATDTVDFGSPDPASPIACDRSILYLLDTNDASSVPILFIEHSFSRSADGSPFTLTENASGSFSIAT